jgi:hypothetical protein
MRGGDEGGRRGSHEGTKTRREESPQRCGDGEEGEESRCAPIPEDASTEPRVPGALQSTMHRKVRGASCSPERLAQNRPHPEPRSSPLWSAAPACRQGMGRNSGDEAGKIGRMQAQSLSLCTTMRQMPCMQKEGVKYLPKVLATKGGRIVPACLRGKEKYPVGFREIRLRGPKGRGCVYE